MEDVIDTNVGGLTSDVEHPALVGPLEREGADVVLIAGLLLCFDDLDDLQLYSIVWFFFDNGSSHSRLSLLYVHCRT